jgi:hypothetical protein
VRLSGFSQDAPKAVVLVTIPRPIAATNAVAPKPKRLPNADKGDDNLELFLCISTLLFYWFLDA